MGRILHWALSTFRIMVIITEMLVMGAFLSRFWLDAKNSDLNDGINVAKAQVSAYSDIETEFRATQKRLSIAKSLYLEDKFSLVMENVNLSLPPDVAINSVTVSGSSVQLKCRSASERSIVQLLTNLENNNFLEKINLTQISSTPDNDLIINFTVNANLAGSNVKGDK